MLPMVQTEPMLFNGGHSDEAAPPSATLPPALTPESEVDELVDIFFDVDVAVNSFSRLESCDLQPGDTWRGMQDKMSVTAPVKKIRKKSDNKPQSQINKCHNEKRRRELENETINQLEELLVTCLAEVKQPDKNGIVREATLQIQEVLRRRLDCPGECPLRAQAALARSPVQAGEVSSTQHSNASLHYSELTTLIEALKHYTSNLGWTLLEINGKGEIECVTENIKDLVLQDRTELFKKSIFDILHEEDHAKITPLLNNINQSFGWSAVEVDKFQAIQARLLIQDSSGSNITGCVECVIHAAPVRGSSAERAGSVMCVIRRCEDASAALLPVDGGPPAITASRADHIVFRLDSTNLTVLSCDLSGVENSSNYPLLVGTNYLELIETSDRARVAAHLHLAACLPAPPAEADSFRLRVAPDKPWLRVSARSRLFRAKPDSGEPDFIMSTHSVLDDEPERSPARVPPLPAPASAPAPARPPPDPLMTSVANGETSDARYRPLGSPDAQFMINDFVDLDPWTSPFLGDMSSEDSKERKEQPEPPARAPSAPLDAPPPGDDNTANRLRKILQTKKTDSNILKDLLKQEDEEATLSETSAPHTPHTPHTPLTPHTPTAALSPLHSAQAHARPPPHAPHSHGQHMQQSHHTNSDVLLKILKEKSDEENDENRRNSDARSSTSQPSALLSQLLSNSNGPSGNRSQDNTDYLAGMKRRIEESKGGGLAKRMTPENQQVTSSAAAVASSTPSSTAVSPSTSGPSMSPLCQKNQILVALLARQQTVPPTPPPQPNPVLRAYGPTPRPRQPMPHHQQHPQQHQQMPQHQQMQQHQQMHPAQRHHSTALSSMLAQSRASGVNVNGGPGIVSQAGVGGSVSEAAGGGMQSHLAMVLAGGARSAYPPPAHPPHPPHPPPPHTPHAQQMHYANTAPHHGYAQPPSGRTQAQSGGGGEMEVPNNDQDLSDILDEVIDNMPDADRPAPDVSVMENNRQLRPDYGMFWTIDNMPDADRLAPDLSGMENNRQLRPDYGGKEKNAMINAIRQSLMQCETVTKSPVSSSPGAPPVYAVQSPPGQCSMSGMGGAGYGMASPGGVGGVGGAGAAGGEAARARALAAEQQRARLLQMQRSQQMLVSPEAADPTQQDLGSTINALVSATPPNVNITRTDYHHLYHPSNTIGSNYGTNKITSPQQNPMLSRQLSGPAGSGYGHGSHGPAALHTPMTQQPYLRAPRPQLVGGYYEDGSGAGYCGEFARRPLLAPHAAHAPHPTHPAHPNHPNHPSPHDQQMPCAGNGGTSEYVRNELRAVVGARSRPDLLHPQPDLDPLISFDMPAPGGGSVVGGRASAAPAPSWESHQTPPSTTEAGSAEAGPAASAGGDGTRADGAAGAGGAGGSAAASAGVAGGAAAAGAATKASLLQKLLSQ